MKSDMYCRDRDLEREWEREALSAYLKVGTEGSGESTTAEALDVVKLQDAVVVLTPPSLRLPLIEHFSAACLRA